MRRLIAVAGLAALALAACQKKSEPARTGELKATTATAAAPAGPIAPPKRKPGLWTNTMQTAGMTQTMKLCVGPDTDSKMSAWGQDISKGPCTKNAVTPVPGGWAFESECDMGAGGHIVSRGTATGDFNSAYTVKVSSTTTGARMPQANGAHEMSLTAKYEGPCPADMVAGDMEMSMPGMPKGMRINIEKMAAMRK